jgi:hypothetical protein
MCITTETLKGVINKWHTLLNFICFLQNLWQRLWSVYTPSHAPAIWDSSNVSFHVLMIQHLISCDMTSQSHTPAIWHSGNTPFHVLPTWYTTPSRVTLRQAAVDEDAPLLVSNIKYIYQCVRCHRSESFTYFSHALSLPDQSQLPSFWPITAKSSLTSLHTTLPQASLPAQSSRRKDMPLSFSRQNYT